MLTINKVLLLLGANADQVAIDLLAASLGL